MAGATVGTYIITRALKYNMPKRLVARMMVNQAIDSCIGVIPFIGDIFDIGFKVSPGMALLTIHPTSISTGVGPRAPVPESPVPEWLPGSLHGYLF